MNPKQLIRMLTLVREAIDELETRGKRNASLILYSTQKCDEMIQLLQKESTEKGGACANEPDSNQSE